MDQPLELLSGFVRQEVQPTPHLQDRTMQLFDELREPVFRYLLRLGLRRDQSDEIVQETFLRLHRHLSSGSRQGNVRGWVFRVAHNLVVDAWRTGSDDDLVHDEAATASARDLGLNPEEIVLRKERVRRVREAVRSLSPHQRQCLALRAEGFRYREIAEIVGVRKSAVAECLQRCIDLLIRHGNG